MSFSPITSDDEGTTKKQKAQAIQQVKQEDKVLDSSGLSVKTDENDVDMRDERQNN